MLLPCEIAVKCLLPPVRAALARELTTKHGLSQSEVAKLLGVSQPAISLYMRKFRGTTIDLGNHDQIALKIAHLAKKLVRRENSTEALIEEYCEICKAIRAEGLLCKLHETFDVAIGSACSFCLIQKST